jgi:hypothetical protein
MPPLEGGEDADRIDVADRRIPALGDPLFEKPGQEDEAS